MGVELNIVGKEEAVLVYFARVVVAPCSAAMRLFEDGVGAMRAPSKDAQAQFCS